MDVRLPSGDTITGVPEGTTAEQLLGKLQLAGHPGAQSLLQALASKQTSADLDKAPWGQKFAAGYGGAVPKLWQGTKQALGIGDQKQLQGEIDETRRIDAPLMNTGGGMVGNIAGTAAALSPAMMVPGANTYAGAGIAGGLSGAIQPVASEDKGLYGVSPRAMNTGIGAGAGVAGQAAGNLLGRAISPSTSRLSAEEQALAQSAGREGIPLTAGQATGSRPLQTMESVMENLPMTARPQAAIREGQQRAFTGAVLKRAGMDQDVADAGSMLAQKQALGGRIGEIAGRNELDFNKGLTDRLANIVGDANTHLPPQAASDVQRTADQILSQVGERGAMSGTNYQGWREPLRGLSDGSAAGRYYGQMRKALDEAFSGQMQGAEGETLRSTSRQYANLKTIIDAMSGPGNLPARGQVAPTQLAAALARSVGKENKALGQGDLNELARIGQLFVRDQIPNSGTPQRAFIQSMLTGGGGAGAGAGGLTGAVMNPDDPLRGAMKGAGIGAAIGTAAPLAIPRLVQAGMNSRPAQAYLANQALSPKMRAALTAAMRSGAAGALPALEAQK